ncbi:MAG: DUF4339 domain-containing protein [Myxococcota bacterium]
MSLPDLPAPEQPAIHVHSKARGRLDPLSRVDITQQLGDRALSQEDLFWFNGMEGWKRLGDHPELLWFQAPAPAPAPAVQDEVGDGEVPGGLGVTRDIEATTAQDGALVEAQDAAADEALDAVFGELVEESWRYHHQHSFANHIDEVMVGAIITSCLEGGQSLIDLSSDGTHHYMRFEDLEDNSRMIVRLTHLTGSLTSAAVQGHRVSAIIGYGEKMRNFSKVWQALKAEYKSGLISRDAPGSISVDGDISSQYVYVQVKLFLKVEDYVDAEYDIDYATLGRHLGATAHALRKYLRGRFP